jgi:hypothetical protein
MLALFAIDKMLQNQKINCGGYKGLGLFHSLNCSGAASPAKNHNETMELHFIDT